MPVVKRFILLRGEGVHQHVIRGNIDVKTSEGNYIQYRVLDNNTILHHEHPNGTSSREHQTLQVEAGEWVTGRQVEFNPLSGNKEDVFD